MGFGSDEKCLCHFATLLEMTVVTLLDLCAENRRFSGRISSLFGGLRQDFLLTKAGGADFEEF